MTHQDNADSFWKAPVEGQDQQEVLESKLQAIGIRPEFALGYTLDLATPPNAFERECGQIAEDILAEEAESFARYVERMLPIWARRESKRLNRRKKQRRARCGRRG
jgi:hypothetical protein